MSGADDLIELRVAIGDAAELHGEVSRKHLAEAAKCLYLHAATLAKRANSAEARGTLAERELAWQAIGVVRVARLLMVAT